MRKPIVEVEFTDKDMFIRRNGVRIAKRENRKWISLDPEWEVRQEGDFIDIGHREVGGVVQ
jgi:hypothetical protein